MKLLTDEGNFQALKIHIASASSGTIKLDVEIVKHEARVVRYLSSNRLPVLEVYPKKFIFSVNAAARLLRTHCQPEQNEASVDHWLEWESGCLLPAVFPHLVTTVGGGKTDDNILQDILFFLKHLDTELQNKKTLCEEPVSSADICIWSTLYPVLTGKSPIKGWESEFPNVQSWFLSLSQLEPFEAGIQAVYKGGDNSVLKASLLAQPAPLRVKETGPRVVVQQQKSKPKEDSKPVPEKVIASREEVKVIASREEVMSAKEAWKQGRSLCPHPVERVHPILPQEGRRNMLITSALPYVNNVPHLGNIIGCVLSADVFSRYCRLRNYNSVYVCGTDEYGTATETKAIEEGLTPQQICDKYTAIHAEIYQWFNIDFDHFGRTTTPQQTTIAQDIFWKVYERGCVLKDSIEQLHCQNCDRFLADRFVEGVCPLCLYDDARGDQCDACGKLINATELINPKCKLCKASPQIRTTDHLFLDLPKIEPDLQKHLDKVFQEGTWTNNARVITSSWIRDGLKPRCISRDLKWGTPVPLEGYTDKVFYVWFDAPIGYISITANYTDQWQQWWKNPEQVQMYNFLGKDNVPFHSVIFPATLLGANDNYSIVNHMSATEYLNYEDGKFSKSRGTGVFGDQARDTGIPADVYRFYLLSVRPESQDSTFSWDDFLLRNNSDLLNNFGNFINRALTFVSKNFDGVIQEMELIEDDFKYLALVNRELQAYMQNMEDIKLRDALRNVLSIARLGNQLMQETKPWVLVKGSDSDKVRGRSVISLAANLACLLSVLVQPYMPQISATIQTQLNAPASCNYVYHEFVCQLPPGHKIGVPAPLFEKIEPFTIADLKKRFAGKQAPPSKPKVQKGKAAAAGSTEEKGSPEDIAQLTEEVTKQGNKVRDLKASKAEKSVITEAVSVLLELKKKLTAISGEEPQPAAGGKKKGSKKPTDKSIVPVTAVEAKPMSSPEVELLQAKVTEQANKVRDLKAKKAEKNVITEEVALLLNLKKQLAAGQGLNPDDAVGGGKKKGKK